MSKAGALTLTVILTAHLVAVATTFARAADYGGSVTDLSYTDASVIGVSDITEALAVPRGTRIEPSKPPTVRLPIYFEFDSTTLKPDAKILLETVGAALRSGDLDTFVFSIEGHTDGVGGASYNRALSQKRAEVVKSFLMTRGVQAGTLRTIGHGEDVPVANNDSEDGRQRNRRVEMINLGAIE